jgi:hypothetical protein
MLSFPSEKKSVSSTSLSDFVRNASSAEKSRAPNGAAYSGESEQAEGDVQRTECTETARDPPIRSRTPQKTVTCRRHRRIRNPLLRVSPLEKVGPLGLLPAMMGAVAEVSGRRISSSTQHVRGPGAPRLALQILRSIISQRGFSELLQFVREKGAVWLPALAGPSWLAPTAHGEH